MPSFTRPGSSVIDYNAVTGDSVTTAAQKQDIALNDLYANIVDGTAAAKGIVQLGTTASTAALGNHLHTGIYQTAGSYAASGANSDITSLTGLTTPLSVAQGGTGATTASNARTALGLGSAALLDAGTDPGDVVQLNASGQLPAVSGALLTDLAAAQISGLQTLPAGAVIFHASSSVPAGYLECNGAAVSRATYAALFSAIGTAHGYGDNSSTFNLPDLRGRFVRGWDHAIARDPDRAARTAAATGGATGDAVGSVQTDQYASHTHTVIANDNTNTAIGKTTIDYKGAFQITQYPPTTSSGGSETRPVNINLMACIKY